MGNQCAVFEVNYPGETAGFESIDHTVSSDRAADPRTQNTSVMSTRITKSKCHINRCGNEEILDEDFLRHHRLKSF